MDLEAAFADAQIRVKQLTKRPTDRELLDLYSLFKQATEGDLTADPPSLFDPVARAKHAAWDDLAGTPRDEAMRRYVALVDRLLAG
ncbi:MAG: acyl-CoA-binding protein [Thermoanaerobaculia bacterium]|nr:acyl-CoA-binding protein [Thermoanaerobaculia bacterium]MCZ7649690.1 acyl-CoA-binding protein [Thermoanaerobaculia bacterium]